MGMDGWLEELWEWEEEAGERLRDAADEPALRRDEAAGDAAMMGGFFGRDGMGDGLIRGRIENRDARRGVVCCVGDGVYTEGRSVVGTGVEFGHKVNGLHDGNDDGCD